MMPRTSGADARAAYRRRLHYVDGSVQRSLLMSMVSLELVLVAALGWLAQWRLNDLIEESLYRVHLDQSGPALIPLLQEGSWVLGAFILVNALALLAAEGIWSRHENLVVQDFAALTGKTRELDFSKDVQTRQRHELPALALRWRAHERQRLTAIREQAEKLGTAVTGGATQRELRDVLQRLNRLLS